MYSSKIITPSLTPSMASTQEDAALHSFCKIMTGCWNTNELLKLRWDISWFCKCLWWDRSWEDMLELWRLNIMRNLSEWLHDFLKDRSQTVAANGALSKERISTSENCLRVFVVYGGSFRHTINYADSHTRWLFHQHKCSTSSQGTCWY